MSNAVHAMPYNASTQPRLAWMPEKLHPVELVANLARLAEVRQLLAGIDTGDLDRIDRVRQVLVARERLYLSLTGSEKSGCSDDRQGQLL